MRKIWTTALAVCLMSLATVAVAGVLTPQEPPATSNPSDEAEPGRLGRGRNIEKRLEDLNKQLNLTAQQKGKIRPLLKHEAKRIREVRSNTTLTQAQLRRRIAMIRRTTNQHIAELLTPEQKQKWQDVRQDRRGSSPQGGQGGTGGPGVPAAPQNPPHPN